MFDVFVQGNSSVTRRNNGKNAKNRPETPNFHKEYIDGQKYGKSKGGEAEEKYPTIPIDRPTLREFSHTWWL